MKFKSENTKGILIAFLGALLLTPDTLFMRLSEMDVWTMLFWRGFQMGAILILMTLSVKEYRENFFLIQSNWASCFQENSIDCIISNPPYIDKDDSHLADLKYEPLLALVTELHGLEAFEIISQQAKQLLKKDGLLLLEHGFDQSEHVEKIIYKNDLKLIRKIKDLSGNDRVILAQK